MQLLHELEKIALSLTGPPFKDHLVEDAWPEGDDPGYRVAVLCNFDDFTRRHPPQDGASLLSQLTNAYSVIHSVYIVAQISEKPSWLAG